MSQHRHAALAAPLALAITLAAVPAAADPPNADPFLGRDKALHFGASAALAGVGYGASALGGMEHRVDRAVMGVSVAIGVGFAKEVLDAAGLGTPSWKDFTWDVLGTIAGVGLAFSIDYAVTQTRPAAHAR